MKTARKTGLFFIAMSGLLLAACDSTPTEPEAGGGYLLDRVSANRDFQPPTPDDRLTVHLVVRRLDGQEVPPGVNPTQVEATLLSSGETWETGFDRITHFEGQVEALARRGPRWPVGEFVEISVVVEDGSGGPTFRLSVARVQITSSS